MDFVNLHQHSIYSIRDSVAKIEDIVVRSKELGYHGACLTDHGKASGLINFYKTCKKHEIKPILGVEFYIANRSRFSKENKVDKYHHLILIAMNNTGWINLCKLVSESYKQECFYRKPRIDRELLKQHSEGLICLSACIAGQVPAYILRDIEYEFVDEEGNVIKEDTEKAESFQDLIAWHKSVFGDRYYLEIQNHGIDAEQTVANVIMEEARRQNIKVIATLDSHYVYEDDKKTHDLMLAIRDRITIDSPKLKPYPGDGYFIMNESQLYSRFSNHEVLTNSMEVFERCNVDFKFGDFQLPQLLDPMTEDQLFHDMVFDGLKNKIKIINKEYSDRLETEIKVINQMNFPSYFIMVSDFLGWAKNNGVPTGPGRGSAAGSLVAYALGITDVDPIKFDTSFERFLNSGRSSYPVIDFKEYPLENFKNEFTK